MTRSKLTEKTKEYSFQGHLGDQDLYTLMGLDHPELFYVLPCGWNRQLCSWWRDHGYQAVWDLYFNCTAELKILHGNCGTPIPDDLWYLYFALCWPESLAVMHRCSSDCSLGTFVVFSRMLHSIRKLPYERMSSCPSCHFMFQRHFIVTSLPPLGHCFIHPLWYAAHLFMYFSHCHAASCLTTIPCLSYSQILSVVHCFIQCCLNSLYFIYLLSIYLSSAK